MTSRPLHLRPFSGLVEKPNKGSHKRLSLLKRVTYVHAESRISYVYFHRLTCGHVVAKKKKYDKLLGCHQCAHAVNQFTRSLKV